MADVQEEGKPQLWNHKQNDALGLYLDLLIQANNTGTINAEDWEKGDRLKSVALLIAYLDKANFYVMEDSGEEDARLNTSSVALVTSGLERLSNLLSKKDSVFVLDLLREAKVNELDETLSTTRLNHLIDKGYERITLQLDLGENPQVIWKKINITEKPMRLYLMLFILQIFQEKHQKKKANSKNS